MFALLALLLAGMTTAVVVMSPSAHADGYGGLVTCVLDGWFGFGQSAPGISIVAGFDPDADLGDLTNVGTVSWTDPDVPEQERVLSVSQDDAVITLVLSAAEILALTGFGSVSLLWAALALLAAGALLLWFSRRRADEAA